MNMILMRVAVGAVASVLVSGIAMAQNTEKVKVQTKRVLITKAIGRTSNGVPIIDVSVSYGVNVAGLDLASNAGAAELSRRISDAAQAACKELSRQYPDATPDDAECAKRAADKAMIKLHKLVAAAQAPGK